jgi:hypothetical protein
MATNADTELMLDVGQANELKLAARRSGYTKVDLKRLSEGDLLARLLPVVRGLGEVTVVKHIINLDKDPLIPWVNFTVEEHRRGGQFEWDPKKVRLFLSKNQQGDKTIKGHELRKEFAKKPVCNANLLDYLVEHPELIPEDWKLDKKGNTRSIYFWGTIYRGLDGRLYVRHLYFHEGLWQSDNDGLAADWYSYDPAACLAS